MLLVPPPPLTASSTYEMKNVCPIPLKECLARHYLSNYFVCISYWIYTYHWCPTGLKSLRECTSLDLDALRHDVGEKSYVRLKQAVLSLDLEFWLEDNGLKSVHSSLVKEGYATRRDLYMMTVEEAQEVHMYYCNLPSNLPSLCKCPTPSYCSRVYMLYIASYPGFPLTAKSGKPGYEATLYYFSV